MFVFFAFGFILFTPQGGAIMNDFYFQRDAVFKEIREGVERSVRVYTDDLMLCELHFKAGERGKLHHHPNTQITYIVKGVFEVEVDGVKKVVKSGDAILARSDIEHGCSCLEDGVLLDIFTPMRKDFV